MGRHIIGYEVQKVLALVDFFAADAARAGHKRPLGIMGYAEGGLIALDAAALDPRIDVATISGYFSHRERVWEEPIYRNVFSLFANLATPSWRRSLRRGPLIVEAARGPDVTGPPKPGPGVSGGAAPGKLTTPDVAADVSSEIVRAGQLAGLPWKVAQINSAGGAGPPGSDEALKVFLDTLQPGRQLAALGDAPHVARATDPQRLKRQFDQLVDYTQHLLAEAEYTRRNFWGKADRQSRSPEKWRESTVAYRNHFYDQVIGRFDLAKLPPHVRTRKVYDQPAYTGYEVMMDVFPDVFAYGILLVPKGMKPGERRPVVVCQHGLEGRPQFVADPAVNNPAYNQYAVRLADAATSRTAPQNPYIFEDRFRTLQRKANPLGKTLFSIIVPQHEQAVDWLASLDFVDPTADRVLRTYRTAAKQPCACRRSSKSIACRFARPISTSGSGRTSRRGPPTAICTPANTRCSSSTWATPSTTPRWRA